MFSEVTFFCFVFQNKCTGTFIFGLSTVAFTFGFLDKILEDGFYLGINYSVWAEYLYFSSILVDLKSF